MNRFALGFSVAFLCVALGCGGLAVGRRPPGRPFADASASPNKELTETVTKNGVQYQIEHSGAHASIRWGIGPNRMAALLSDAADIVSLNDIDTLAGYRYSFRKECEGIAKVGHEKYGGLRELQVTLRVLEYTDKERMYLRRGFTMSGEIYKTYVVVASWPRAAGNFSHWIEQQTNDLEKIEYCRE
jgi:hypothetical protein